jgi:hypothetical protein
MAADISDVAPLSLRQSHIRGQILKKKVSLALSLLRQLVAGIRKQRPEFSSAVVHVGFTMDEVALAQTFSQYFGVYLSVILPPSSHIYLTSALVKLTIPKEPVP